jgi:uncharacterized protein
VNQLPEGTCVGPGRFYRAILFPPIRMVIGLFWVGAAIGLGSGASSWLPQGAKMLTPLLLALGAVVGYYTFVRIVERRPVAELFSRGCLKESLTGALVGVGLFSIVIGILFLLGSYSITAARDASAVIPAMLIAVMAGVTEELLIRGVAFRILESWLGSWIALGITAVLFGALHLANPQATALSSAAIALEAGVMLAAAYMVTRKLWLAIGIHAAWNFTQSGIFGVATSGVASHGYFKGQLHGPALLSGGAFGPEGSLVAVAVCLAAGLWMLRVARARGHFTRPSWQVGIRKARPGEAALLSALAMESKAHWGYSVEVLEKWRPDLTITPEDIVKHPTYVAETGGRVVGFYMLHMTTPLQTLEHLWIHPASLRRGVGTQLINHALAPTRDGRGAVRVVADPFAAGFYEHHGGVRTDFVAAPIPGMPDRTLPVYEFR